MSYQSKAQKQAYRAGIQEGYRKAMARLKNRIANPGLHPIEWTSTVYVGTLKSNV